jgi:hypothetical protein
MRGPSADGASRGERFNAFLFGLCRSTFGVCFYCFNPESFRSWALHVASLPYSFNTSTASTPKALGAVQWRAL